MATHFLSIILSLLFTVNAAFAQICRIDLGIILDDSGSIKRWGFEQEKNFVRSVTRQLHVSNSNTRVSVMTFSSYPKMRIHFRDRAGQNLNSLNWALNGIRHWGGWTYTDRALNLARERMFNEHYGSRKGAPKMLLLLTDGKSQSGHQKLSYAATLLKNKFVNIISIGVGHQIRRSELELIASRPIHQHVFQVRDVWALKQIVNTVKTEACKPITCWFIDCIYNEWSAWSGTCYQVRRTRSVRQEIRKSKMVVGGCAGLNILNCKPEVETKNLGVCLQTCKYVKCHWAPWGGWSATCGRSSRQRQIKPHPSTTQRRTCLGLPQRCYQRPETQNRFSKCTCNYVKCKYGQWSRWSTTCGKGDRRRTMQTIRKTSQRNSCDGLPQTCSSKPDVQTRTQKCTCNYVECKYGQWSRWSTTCGKGDRRRTMQTIRKTSQRNSCDGLPQTCSSKPDVQTRTQKCSCDYVECKYGEWSAWSTSCGKGQRSRPMKAIKKTTQRDNCNGLTKTCPTKPDVQTRTNMCKCDYVECKYGEWSAWSTSCGKGQRSRPMKAIKKTTQRDNCNGLTKTCPTKPDVQTRTNMCKCDYVECKYGEWSAWSTSCGKGQRSRPMKAIKKTTQRDNCNGLTKTCPTKPDVQTRTNMCKCDYVECKYGEWSAWSTSCGKGQRSRPMKAIKKTTQRDNCNGLTKTCPTKPDVQTRTNMCKCDYVECKYGEWSAWSTSCGKGQRSRPMKAIKKTTQRDNCNGLTKTCPTKPDVQTRTNMCKCNYVECKYGEWSAWSTSCGKGERGRKLKPIQRTKEAENCDGLPQTCSATPDVETRTAMCTCKYVDCNYGPWSPWTTSCGMGERGRKMQTVQKTKQAEKCDGLPKSCPTKPDIEKRNKLCKCDYVECKYTEWTNWNPACGKNMERKRTLQTIKKTVEKESCTGLTTTCTGDAEQTEKKDDLCECDAVKCVVQWSAWSATCGMTKRVMRFVKVPIKVKKESCEGLKTTCPDVTETQVDDIPCPKTAAPTITEEPSQFDATCSTQFKIMGCFKDEAKSRETFKKILFIDPYKRSRAYGFDDYVFGIVCRCAVAAKAGRYHYFAVSSQGHCMAGVNEEDSWRKQSAVPFGFCLNAHNERCHYGDSHCVGSDDTLFAYKVIP